MKNYEETIGENAKTVIDNQYSCGHCKIVLTSLQELKDHLSTSHKEKSEGVDSKQKPKSKDKPKNSLKCNQCNKELNPYYLPIHIASVHEKRNDFECDKCGKLFAIKDYLDKHKRVIHEGIKPKPRPKNHVKCNQCDKDILEYYLAKHIEIVHGGKKDFACDFCDKKFASKRYLNRHKVSIHQDGDLSKILQCSKCDKKFKQKSNLKTHEECHDTRDAAGQPPTRVDP